MTLYLDGHTLGYELQRVVRLFFFGEKVETAAGAPPDDGADFLHTRVDGQRLEVRARLSIAAGQGALCSPKKVALYADEDTIAPTDTPADLEHKIGVMLYRLLAKVTGLRPAWGVLTGIRPVKLLLSHAARGMDDAALHERFVSGSLVDESKFALALETAKTEQAILARSTPDSFSLYISIPFCPTRCAYCSFVSHAIERAAKLIPDYVDRLCDELVYTAEIAARLRLKLRTVYFGGGTPTTLSAEQLARIMGEIAARFDLSHLWEYTVEAGRPDTITRDKLLAIKAGGAGRISINPQTLSDEVLAAIGRKHTTARFYDAVALARDCGFDNINMDLIAGLPADTPDGFRRSVDGVLALFPENVTVHTLTVKRASRVTFAQARDELETVGGMVDYARTAVAAAGLAPYYLYRQTGSLSNLENVGYSRAGFEGLYNVYIMDETHSIFAVGAGASTKLRHPTTGAFERLYNHKYPYEYMAHFDVIKARKARILSFYGI